jgi:hypothetical protein
MLANFLEFVVSATVVLSKCQTTRLYRRSIRVRHSIAHGCVNGIVTIRDESGTRIITEKANVSLSTLISAVGTNVVCSGFIFQTTRLVIISAIILPPSLSVSLKLRAYCIILDVEFLIVSVIVIPAERHIHGIVAWNSTIDHRNICERTIICVNIDFGYIFCTLRCV